MSEKRCEKCGANSPSPGAAEFELFDYCAACSADLCNACMAKGHCGYTPARSGTQEDGEAEVAS